MELYQFLIMLNTIILGFVLFILALMNSWMKSINNLNKNFEKAEPFEK